MQTLDGLAVPLIAGVSRAYCSDILALSNRGAYLQRRARWLEFADQARSSQAGVRDRDQVSIN